MNEVTMRAARNNAGFSQEEMAKELDMSLSTYQRFERKPSRMRVGDFLKFCRVTKWKFVSDIKIE